MNDSVNYHSYPLRWGSTVILADEEMEVPKSIKIGSGVLSPGARDRTSLSKCFFPGDRSK